MSPSPSTPASDAGESAWHLLLGFAVVGCAGLVAWNLLPASSDAADTPVEAETVYEPVRFAETEDPSSPTPAPEESFEEALARGQALFEERAFEEASGVFGQLYAAEPERPDVAHWFGKALLELEEFERSERYLQDAVDADPENAEYVFALAQVVGMQISETTNPISQMGLASRSKKLLDRTVELDPTLSDARLGRILFFLMAPTLMGGGIDKAKAEAAAIAESNEAVGLFAEGWLAEQEERFVEAEELHRRSIELDPDYARVRRRLGYLLLGQNRWSEAHEQFAAYLEIEPYNPAALEGLSQALVGLGRLDEALARAREATVLAPDYRAAVLQLAKAEAATGDVDEARKSYARFIELADGIDGEDVNLAHARRWIERHAE